MEPKVCIARRGFVALAVAGHAVAATVYGAVMPHGFGFGHPRTWVNDGGVALVAVLSVLAVPFVLRGNVIAVGGSAMALGGLWLGVVTGTFLCFPETSSAMAGLLTVSAILPMSLLSAAYSCIRARLPIAVAIGVAAALTGGGLAAAHRAPPASTRPSNTTPLAVPANRRDAPDPEIELYSEGRFAFDRGGLSVDVEPFVRLLSRSPDGAWTLFAEDESRGAPPLLLASAARVGDSFLARYTDDGSHVLRLSSGPGLLEMQAWSTLPAEVHAHLASYLVLGVTGHEQALLRFEACADEPIEVRVADYPVGRPLRFAYRTEDDRFLVVEGTSGEKGPFTALCEGTLRRDEPLVFTVDGGEGHRLTFELTGWSAQGSTEPSPTAGWGVPQATFQFSRGVVDLQSRLFLHFSLASTGVGRGFDSVAHRAGTYDMMLTVRP